jgi:hypothetical protein
MLLNRRWFISTSPVPPPKSRLRWIFGNVHGAFLATLLASVTFFIIFVLPKIHEASDRAERLRAQEISAEHEWYCNRWGMGPGTEMHNQCLTDLQQLRAAIERRIADEFNDI